MIGLPSFAGEFCADQDSADGAASDLETNAGWSSSEESDDSESAAGTPSRQKQPPRVLRVAFGANARARLHGNIDAAAQVLDAGTHAGAGTKSPGRVGANRERSSAAAGAAVPARTPAAPREAASSSSSQSLTHRIKHVGQTPDRQGPFTIEPSDLPRSQVAHPAVAPWPEKLEIKVLGAADLTIRLIRTDSLTGKLMFCVQDLFDWRSPDIPQWKRQEHIAAALDRVAEESGVPRGSIYYSRPLAVAASGEYVRPPDVAVYVSAHTMAKIAAARGTYRPAGRHAWAVQEKLIDEVSRLTFLAEHLSPSNAQSAPAIRDPRVPHDLRELEEGLVALDVEAQQEFVGRAIAHLTCVVDGEGATEGDRLYRALRLIACGPEGMQSVCSAESATASRDDFTDDEDASEREAGLDQPIEINQDLLDGLREMFADRPELYVALAPFFVDRLRCAFLAARCSPRHRCDACCGAATPSSARRAPRCEPSVTLQRSRCTSTTTSRIARLAHRPI
jgi:hypothetical protein